MPTAIGHRPLVSIVCPAFNEEEVLPAFNEELLRVMNTVESEFDCEIIYVDDGSKDSTPAVLLQMALADPRVNYLRLSRNFGNQAAVTAGLERARGDAVVTMDSDLQHPPAVILEMLTEWRAGHDVVLTVRRDNKSLGLVKKLAVPVFYKALRYCSGMDLKPAICDFRLLSRKALDVLVAMPERHRFLRAMVHWLGFPAAEIEFDVPPRFAGRSKFTLFQLVRLARDGLLSFSRVPLDAAVMMAGILLLLSFLGTTTAWFAFRPEGSLGWLLLALIGGAHMVGAGIWVALLAMSEYQARIHEQILGRPLYVVSESSDELRAAEVAFPLTAREPRTEVA